MMKRQWQWLASLLLACTVTTPVAATAQHDHLPHLVRDINQQPAGIDLTVHSQLIEVNGMVFFAAYHPAYGSELWKTDGTEEGTVLVKDIIPGVNSSDLKSLTNVEGTLFFVANDGTSGFELWKSDGTDSGTVLIKDIRPGIYDSSPKNGVQGPQDLINVDGTLYFMAANQTDGCGLWKSDGTEAGTIFIKGICKSLYFDYPASFTNVNGTLFFTLGNQLWKSDGTEAGTHCVKIVTSRSSQDYLYSLTNNNGTLFFMVGNGGNGYQLWKSDGTEGGTIPVLENPLGKTWLLYSSLLAPMVEMNGSIYFVASDLSSGYGSGDLWKSDGTAAGTILVKGAAPGTGSTYFQNLINFNGTLFCTSNYNGRPEIWKSDGSEAGTVPLVNIPGWYNSFVNVNGTLFFVKYSYLLSELWKSDGTAAGTVIVKILPDQFRIGSLTSADGILFFSLINSENSSELWKSDGTLDGTTQIVGSPHHTKSSNPLDLTSVADSLIFMAEDGIYGPTLWKSDGTSDGTAMATGMPVIDFVSATNINGTAFFPANDNIRGKELWKSDGTIAGTVLVKDIHPGEYGSEPQSLTNVNGVLFFVASDSFQGWSIWKSDGMKSGTVPVKYISEHYCPQSLTNVNGTLFFTALNDLTWSYQLWKSDGTEVGTILVKDFGDLRPDFFTNVNGIFFFATSDSFYSWMLWKSDGTKAGTVMVKEQRPDSWCCNNIESMHAVNGILIFKVSGTLWRSDGTEAGTVMLKEYAFDSASDLTVINDTLFFVGNENNTRAELWKSDGTSAGTIMVKEGFPWNASGIDYLTNVNGTLYFVANDAIHGEEIWVSDGTLAGTKLYADIFPGSGGASPKNLTAVNNTLFFTAYTDGVGRELWTADLTPDLSVTVTGPGTVNSTPAGISCPTGSCANVFDQGTIVTLTAHPNAYSRFTGWGGACSGRGDCTVTIANLVEVTASFAYSYAPPVVDIWTVSSSHSLNVPSANDVITVTWEKVFDADGDLLGYATAWSNSDALTPVTVNLSPEYTSTNSAPRADGIWYFYIRTVDKAANYSPITRMGPFLIDTSPEIIDVSPGFGSTCQPTNITISGTSFQSGATARIGTTTLMNIRVENEQSLTGILPGGLAEGSYDITITNPNTKSYTFSASDPSQGGFTVISTTAAEICDDGIDNDCDGLIDTASPACLTSSYYFPSIRDDDASGWENYLTVQAIDPVAMGVKIRIYDLAGNLKATHIYSDTTPGANMPAIAARARLALRPSGVAGPVEGSMIVETTVPAIASTNSIAPSYHGFAIYEGARPRHRHFFPKAFDGPDYYQVFFLVQNIVDTPSTVTVTLLAKTPTEPGHGATLTTTIPPHGTLKIRPSEIADGINFNGSVIISSDKETPGDGLGYPLPALCLYEAGQEALAITGSSRAQTELFFSVIKDGRFGGTLDYQNFLSVANPNPTATALITMVLYNQAGVEEGRVTDSQIQPGGKKTWRPSLIKGTTAIPKDFEGSVVVTADIPVVGQTNTIYPGNNRYGADGFDLLEAAIPAPSLFFPKAYDNLLGNGTGATHRTDNIVYIENPDATARNITIDLYNSNGTLNRNVEVAIAPFATHSFRPKDLVTDDTNAFRGSVRITEVAGLPVAGAIKYEVHKTEHPASPVAAMTIYRAMGQ